MGSTIAGQLGVTLRSHHFVYQSYPRTVGQCWHFSGNGDKNTIVVVRGIGTSAAVDVQIAHAKLFEHCRRVVAQPAADSCSKECQSEARHVGQLAQGTVSCLTAASFHARASSGVFLSPVPEQKV